MTVTANANGLVVRGQLRDLIAHANVGDRLPSERDLSERWGAARMTIRRAMDSLVAEGLVARRHGSGTYVTPQPFVRALGLTSFSQDMRQRGLVPGSRLLAFRFVEADTLQAAQMRVSIGEQVVSFTRLRLGSDEAMAVETVWLPARLVPGLVRSDLDGSLYELLSDRYRIDMGAAKVTIEPLLPERHIRDLLTIGPDQACLRVHMVDSDTRGRVVMIADCVYRGDKYHLTADVSGAAFSTAQSRRAG